MERNEALNQIETIKTILDENRRVVTKISPYLILWGIISIIGFLLTPMLKELIGFFWTIMGIVGGAVSAFLGKRESDALGIYSEIIGRQIGYTFLGMFVSGWAATIALIYILTGKIDGIFLGVIIGMTWSAVISMAWFITGVIGNSSPYMIFPSVALLFSSTVSAIVAPQLFYYVIAVFGGGSMVISGILARTKNI